MKIQTKKLPDSQKIKFNQASLLSFVINFATVHFEISTSFFNKLQIQNLIPQSALNVLAKYESLKVISLYIF